MRVATAVRRELRELAATDAKAATSVAAAIAVVLAKELDEPDTPASTKAQIARTLAEMMDRLRGPPARAPGRNRVDELTARRDARLARDSAP